MTDYDPQLVGTYGKLVEKWAAEKYGLDLSYPKRNGLRFDAIGPNGSPWEVKGSNVDGVRPTYKFWRDQHRELKAASGGYVLVKYRVRPSGDEITVLESRSVRATNLRITNWTNPGEDHHRSHTKEAQIPADSL